MNIPLLIISFMIIFIIIFVIIIIYAVKKEKEIYNNGIEIDGVVSRVEYHPGGDNHISSYHCYVKYLGDDNMEHEGRLNANLEAPIGRKIKIKYIPGKYDYVVFVSQELE